MSVQEEMTDAIKSSVGFENAGAKCVIIHTVAKISLNREHGLLR